MKALGDRVFVRVDPPPQKAGLIWLTRHRNPQSTGRVISVGTGKRMAGWELKPGDRVHFKPYAGREIEFRGQPLLVLEPQDVLAVVEETPNRPPSTPYLSLPG